MRRSRAAVVLAAGQGTRMRSSLPKVLHKVGGKTLIDWAIDAAAAEPDTRVVVVVGPHAPQVRAHVEARLGPDAVAVQDEPRGTAHAVRAAERALAGFAGWCSVSYADAPLVRAESFARLEAPLAAGASLAVLAFEAENPFGYGRMLLDAEGGLERIVEEKDASPAERAVRLCNSGLMMAEASLLFSLLADVRDDNAKREFYLTDIVALARARGLAVAAPIGEAALSIGVNSRAELAAAEAAFQARSRAEALAGGVTLIDPQSVFFAHDTALSPDVTIDPHVVFGPGVRIASGAWIRAFSHIEGAEIGEGCEIGPFARLRPGARLERKARIGNFVEVKNARFGAEAKANHLSYIGDADIGARANIGAGVITCNYDGFDKHRTEIGEDAFIGSDTALVAPVRVGAGAYTGSGSVITRDVPDGALAVARGRQSDIAGWAQRFLARKRAARAVKDGGAE